MSGYRLASGGRIDRDRRLEFTFNGRPMAGYAGDTLASALIANGVDIVARSFKYRRPRGIVAAGAEEPNAILQLGCGARTRTLLFLGHQSTGMRSRGDLRGPAPVDADRALAANLAAAVGGGARGLRATGRAARRRRPFARRRPRAARGRTGPGD